MIRLEMTHPTAPSETQGLTIDEYVTAGTTGMIIVVFAVFCACYWCNRGKKVSSEQLREEFANEHGLDAEHLAKGRLYRAVPIPVEDETAIT